MKKLLLIFWGIPKVSDFIFDLDSDTIYVPEIYWGSRNIGYNDHIIISKFKTFMGVFNRDTFEEIFDIISSVWCPELLHHNLMTSRTNNIIEYPCKLYCRFPIALA